MQITALNHVNVLTEDPDRLARWYEGVLGLKRGFRPAFGVEGIWLYLGGTPILHLDRAAGPLAPGAGRLEHFALTATGLTGFLKRLDEAGIDHEEVDVPEAGIVQVNLHDMDGNHIHVDFRLSEKG